MSRKPDPDEIAALEVDAMEKLSREATADDSGERNASLSASDLYPGTPAADPAPDAPGWSAASVSDDDDDWDDEDWDEDWDDDPSDSADAQAALVDGIRGAMDDISAQDDAPDAENWDNSDDDDRKSAARSRLGDGVEDSEARILAKTNSEMTNVMSSRRRSAMAHLKKAAAATKADRVLSHVASRDPSNDFDEQSPYRDDLAKVVKPRATSRPVSRPVSRTPKIQASWESAPSDNDAELIAEASEAAEAQAEPIDRSAFEAERQQHLPVDLSEDDFTSDEVLVTATADETFDEDDSDEDWPETDAPQDDDEDDDLPTGPAAWAQAAFDDDEVEMSDEDRAVALATRRASRVRSTLVEDPGEDDDFDALAEPASISESNTTMAEDKSEELDAKPWTAPSLDDDAGRPTFASRDAGDPPGSDTPRETPSETASDAVSDDVADVEADAIVQVPTPAMGRAARSAGRVKTRLLGFQAGDEEPDVFGKADTAPSVSSQFPVGWIVVVDGPGHGHAFTLQGGVMQIGRGEGQGVRLDFGDTAISRENHAAVAYDDEAGKFFLGHGGKSNLVRLNGHPVLSTEELSDRDRIRIGETTLMFVALCNEEFIWNADKGADTE